MNKIEVYVGMTHEMKWWMKEQLVLKRPHAEIVADFIEMYPGFGKVNGQARPFEVLDSMIRSRIKNMMRGKLGDEIRQRHRSNEQSDQMTLADKDYRDKKRQEIWDEKQAILGKLSDETLSPSQQRRLMKQLSVLDSLRRDLDAYERSENRQSSNSVGWSWDPEGIFPNEDDFVTIEVEETDSKPKLPPAKIPKEPEPTEPEWYEIDDAEHITV